MIAYKTINGFSNYFIGNNGEVYNKQTQYSKRPIVKRAISEIHINFGDMKDKQ